MKKALMLLLVTTMLLVGCGNDKNTTNQIEESWNNLETELPDIDNDTEPEAVEDTTTNTNQDEQGTNDSSEDEETSQNGAGEEPVIDPDGKIFSRLTGLEITEAESLKRPIVVMLDNHYKARPQAGLSDAEVVYEILAEGLITRYMAVFQKNEPAVIGPVRSSRPYYIERALEFNPLYVHVGGSMQALTDIINYNMADVDGLSVGAGVFYRTEHKNMPHNAYSSHDGIRKEGNRKGYYTEVEFAGMPITYQYSALNGAQALEVKVVYKPVSANDAVGYNISFEYDALEKHYLRYVNGIAHLDEETKIHLTADNIIVQKVGHKVIDDAGRREVYMIGSGMGYYINRGEVIDITWEKTSARGQTRYFKADGSELLLNPGITWVQVIPSGSEPIID